MSSYRPEAARVGHGRLRSAENGLKSARARIALFVVICATAAPGLGCGKSNRSRYPGTSKGAQQLISEFLKKGANYTALTEQLRPTKEDYASIFKEEFASKLEAAHAATWNQPINRIAPGPGETEIKLFGATAMELEQWRGLAKSFFPEEWRAVGPQLKHRDLLFYQVRFVKPNSSSLDGATYTGLIYVNGQWRYFPGPAAALQAGL